MKKFPVKEDTEDELFPMT